MAGLRMSHFWSYGTPVSESGSIWMSSESMYGGSVTTSMAARCVVGQKGNEGLWRMWEFEMRPVDEVMTSDLGTVPQGCGRHPSDPSLHRLTPPSPPTTKWAPRATKADWPIKSSWTPEFGSAALSHDKLSAHIPVAHSSIQASECRQIMFPFRGTGFLGLIPPDSRALIGWCTFVHQSLQVGLVRDVSWPGVCR